VSAEGGAQAGHIGSFFGDQRIAGTKGSAAGWGSGIGEVSGLSTA
jgi:hypothetical protein